MSQRWYFNLETSLPNTKREREIIADLRNTNEEASYAIDEDGYSQEDSPWYSEVDDMTEFSKKYPDVLFTLEINGSTHDEWTKHYFQNGKHQACHGEIVYEEFDSLKMQ